MSGLDEVADSTDWLNTPLSGLAPLESGLRCQVCKDFFTTPMITSCSHTFCSLCIRRYLSQEGKCPACREPDQEMKLRRNWTVEELVAHFTQSREAILAYAREPPAQQESHESERPKKRRKIEPTSNGTGRSTRSQSRKQAASASQEPTSTQEEVADSEEEGSVHQDERVASKQSQKQSPAVNSDPHDGLVACPSCHRRLKETVINTHLDRCLAGLPTSPEPPSTAQVQPASNGTASLAFAQRTKSPTVVAQKDRLPSINYALYTEASLRKKLKELGIPNHGNKELMRKRHIEWMNLWNANCDSSRPKPKRDLLRELDTWERTLGRQIERNTTTSSGVMVKDFDRDGWVKTQKGEFDDLIKKAREKRKAATASEDTIDEEDTKMTDGTVGDASDIATQPHPPTQQEAGSDEGRTAATTGINGEPPPHEEVAFFPPAEEAPGTPQKTELPIDLTSSPAAGMQEHDSQRTPGKQRSKFFV